MNMYTGVLCLFVVSVVAGESWQWPDSGRDSRADSSPAEAVRIDAKVRFTDQDDHTEHKIKSNRQVVVQQDETPFEEALDTEGFYNQPAGVGRYPVQVQAHSAPYRVDGNSVYSMHGGSQNRNSDGTLDSIQYCKCVTKPDCNPLPNSASACGADKYLCCYRRPNIGHNNEFFNEIEDERPMLLPGNQNIARPFPPPPVTEPVGLSGPGYGQDPHNYRPQYNQQRPNPNFKPNPAVLVGPGGPTGVIGPTQQKPGVLVGPEGPTGIIGPVPFNQNQGPGILVGPGGPKDNIRQSESAQRGVLVGPGGPTGIIGPAGFNRRPLLIGPGGPTGTIGPYRQRGVLVGPGGPTGMIGPGYGGQRGLLVGPGGPSGYIGPQGYNYFGK